LSVAGDLWIVQCWVEIEGRVVKCEQEARARLIRKRGHDDGGAQRMEDPYGLWRKEDRCWEGRWGP